MSSSVHFDFTDDGPTAEQLATVVTLAEQQVQLEDQVADLQRQLDAATLQLRSVSERDLPTALNLAGLDSFTLTGGRKVSVDVKIVASPTKAQQPEMLEWLEDNDHGDIIKHEVKASFGRGEDGLVDRMLTWVRSNLPKQKLDDRRFVHPQTLSAFVREQLAKQVDLPEAFGILVIKRAVITRPKEDQSF